MLLIGDIHLTAKIKTELLGQLKAFIHSKPEEKNLIFLGDFVYHFSYDRTSLLELFEYFLELYSQGKHVYILAGNHDWLGESFVFEEGKQVFDLLQKQQTEGKIYFITQPQLTEIEDEKILFLPFSLILDESRYPNFELGKTELTEALCASKDKNEQFSGKINQLVNAYIKEGKNLTIIHHYYTNKEKFPGYRSSFAYKDIALSEQLLDEPGIKLISGHLHAPFIFKNYLCTGSAWATSSLEVNQIKGFFTYHQGKISFYGQQLKNYLELEAINATEKSNIESLYRQNIQLLENNFRGNAVFSLSEFQVPDIDIKKTHLTLKVKDLNYDEIDEVLNPELRNQLSDFRLKKSSAKVDDLLSQLEKPDQDKLQTFGGWKELLKDFLKTHHPDEYIKFEQILKELKIL